MPIEAYLGDGLVSFRIKGKSVIESATFANKVGAAAVQKLGGGRKVPTLAEV